MLLRGICEKYQSWEWISLALRLVKFNILSTGIFRKYPSLTWYICSIYHAIVIDAAAYFHMFKTTLYVIIAIKWYHGTNLK